MADWWLPFDEPALWVYLNGCTVRHQTPDFLDLGVGDRYAAIRPVDQSVGRTDVSLAVRETVNHDVATSVNPLPSGTFRSPAFGYDTRNDLWYALAAFLPLMEYVPSGVLPSPFRIFAPTGFFPNAIF